MPGSSHEDREGAGQKASALFLPKGKTAEWGVAELMETTGLPLPEWPELARYFHPGCARFSNAEQ
ncbi:hypothetical protein AAFJ72_16635 [Brevibacillus gelatini]|uniref:Uncharacterized protein n=1 Tax=Brevibacillus gelatini TaxID=1655277 RepID=A0A3M8ALC2_9BACL|nr:hypothetical protein [Brevibacillus gelatini]RNB52002.1 hypothetical protein EDM57_22025 [Brevibacillus gelatini]